MLLWLVLLACLSGSATAGQLRDVWEFNLGANYSGAPLEVFGLSFSPDGQRIAALVGHSWEQEFILLLDTADPRSGQKRLEINPKISEVGPYVREGFFWSASGKQFVVGQIRVRVEDGATCSFPDSAGALHFTGEDTLVGATIRSIPPPDGRGFSIGRPAIEFFDSDCQRVAADVLDQSLCDASPERGLICAVKAKPPGILIADASGKTVHLESSAFDRRSRAMFADAGRAICGIKGFDWSFRASCLDVTSGKEIRTTKEFTYIEIRAARRAPRLVISKYGLIPDFIDFRWALGSLHSRTVWDFRTGRELASWHPKTQLTHNLGFPSGHKEPYPFAISADGEYVAEGGSGMVALHKIEP